jgi:hypothetical protein
LLKTGVSTDVSNIVQSGNKKNSTTVSGNNSLTFPNMGKLDGAALKFAPIATSMASAAIIAANKPEMRDINDFTMNEMLSPNYVDGTQAETAVRRETDKSREMISQVSGSSGQLASNLIGASTQGLKAVADMNLNVQQMKMSEKSRVEAANTEIEMRNNQIRMTNREANRADRAAYLSALMDELNNAGVNLGQLGLEKYRMNQANELGFDFYADVYGNQRYIKRNQNNTQPNN